jgi:hypothetical protein
LDKLEEFFYKLRSSEKKVEFNYFTYVPRPKKTYHCIDCDNLIFSQSVRCVTCSDINRTKIKWPSKEILEKLIWEKPTNHIAKDYECSDKAIEKRIKKYGLSKPPRGYW